MTARLIQLNRQLNSPLNVTQLSPLHRDYFSQFWEKATKCPFTLMLITSRCAEVLISSSSKLAFPGTFPPWVVNSVQEEATVHIAHIMGLLLVTIVTRSYHGSHKKSLVTQHNWDPDISTHFLIFPAPRFENSFKATLQGWQHASTVEPLPPLSSLLTLTNCFSNFHFQAEMLKFVTKFWHNPVLSLKNIWTGGHIKGHTCFHEEKSIGSPSMVISTHVGGPSILSKWATLERGGAGEPLGGWGGGGG